MEAFRDGTCFVPKTHFEEVCNINEQLCRKVYEPGRWGRRVAMAPSERVPEGSPDGVWLRTFLWLKLLDDINTKIEQCKRIEGLYETGRKGGDDNFKDVSDDILVKAKGMLKISERIGNENWVWVGSAAGEERDQAHEH